MKVYLYLFLLAGISFVASAQNTPPSWTQDTARERSYPAQEWYTGFVRDLLKTGANVATMLRTLERDAQNQLAESIIVTIEGDTRMENASRQVQSGGRSAELITTDYRQAVRTATAATTVKTEVKSYHNPTTGELFAFAAVQRAELSAYYRMQINVDLNKVETAISTSDQLVAAGKKMSARRKIEEAKQILGSVTFYSDLLVAVDANSDENSLQTARSSDLMRTVQRLLIQLEQSTFVYMNCTYEYKGYKDDAFSSDPGIMCDIIAQALSENECSVTDNRDEADYELTLITSTTQRSDGKGNNLLSYYANVKGALYNRMTQKKTVDFSILNDPDAYAVGRSPEDAATKAFKKTELKDRVLEKILPKIKD